MLGVKGFPLIWPDRQLASAYTERISFKDKQDRKETARNGYWKIFKPVALRARWFKKIVDNRCNAELIVAALN